MPGLERVGIDTQTDRDGGSGRLEVVGMNVPFFSSKPISATVRCVVVCQSVVLLFFSS